MDEQFMVYAYNGILPNKERMSPCLDTLNNMTQSQKQKTQKALCDFIYF